MQIIGWKEWIRFPGFDIPLIEAKIDTGAKTSCLHAFQLEPFEKNNTEWIRFWLHPQRNNIDEVSVLEAPVIDQRQVSDSGGHREMRYVIQVEIILAGQQWPIEITLTNRDSMQYRMLLGRQAMKQRFLVNPSRTHLTTQQESL